MGITAVKSTGGANELTAGAGRTGSGTRAGAHTIRLITACSALLACLIVIGTGVILENLRARALADAERELRNMALVLAEQTDQLFEAVALAQSGVIDRIENLRVHSAADLRKRVAGYDAHLMLKDTINGLPHVESIAVFDPDGNIVNFSRAWPVPALNVSDRDYFKALKATQHATAVLSEAVLNRTTGTWSIYLARRYSAPDGELIGVVVGGMERRYFEQLFNNIKLGTSGSISLIRSDGALLAGHPVDRGAGHTYALGQMLPAGSDQVVARMTNADGDEHVVAMRAVAHYPMAVAVGIPSKIVLVEWRNFALYLGSAAAFLVLAIAGITFVGVRQFRSYSDLTRERMERKDAEVNTKATELVLRETERVSRLLNQQKVLLDTTLENVSQGVIMLDANAKMQICNRRYIEMYGLDSEIVKPGCTLRELLEHRAKIGLLSGNIDETIRKIMDAIARGTPSSMTTPLADGRIISVATQPMEGGGWVATHQDVTEQRRAERESERMQKVLLTVIENVPVTIVVKDARDLKYVLINRAGERLYGLARSEVMGRTSHQLFPRQTAELIVAHDRQLLQSDGEVRFDPHAIETPANGRRWVAALRIAIRNEKGQPQFLLSVIDDVTGQTKAA